MKKLIAKLQINNEDLIAQQEDAIRYTKVHKKRKKKLFLFQMKYNFLLL